MPNATDLRGSLLTAPTQAKVEIAQGSTVAAASRQTGVAQQARPGYRGLRIDQVRHLKRLESENVPLRKSVADLTLDNQIVKGATKRNF